jgi:hypothetical protein
MKKIVSYSSSAIKKARHLGLSLKFQKLLGKDGGTTGYMIVEGETEAFDKMYKAGIWPKTWAFESEEEGKWVDKKQKPRDFEPTKAFRRFLNKMIDMSNPVPAGDKGGGRIAAIVRALDPEAEVWVKEKGSILAIGFNDYIKIMYPKKDWNDGDCMHFKVLAKYDFKDEKWYVKTRWPRQQFKKQLTPFEAYTAAENSLREDRYDDYVYDGITDYTYGKNPGRRNYKPPKTLNGELHKVLDDK